MLIYLLLLLIPLALLFGATCSLHAWGYVDMGPCGPVTGVYHVNVHSDANSPSMSVKIRELFSGLYAWRELQYSKQPVPSPAANIAASTVDWGGVIDARIAELQSALELKSNRVASEQKQQKSEFDTAMAALHREMEDLKQSLNKLDDISSDILTLKLQISQQEQLLSGTSDYKDAIAKLRAEIRDLKLKLGDVDLSGVDGGDSGILFYLYNELSNLRGSLEKEQPKEVVLSCPDSGCVCVSDLELKLQALYERVMAELNGGTTVIIGSDNSTSLSEQLVRKMIHEELDIFAADQTGMVDFALQSMGGQVVSSRCSQTYSEFSPMLRLFGLPLYYMEKDPSVVIQPGVSPGDGWCFHGSAGSLVIAMADDIKFNSFSLEHISAKQSATGEILSAPRDIEVYGLTSEMDVEGQKIGRWRYEKSGPRLQFFPVRDVTTPAYRIVELRVLTNWGQPDHTCLYRFRVHGKLASLL